MNKDALTRWYAAATDIEDRKQAEQQLENENVVLREEIDKHRCSDRVRVSVKLSSALAGLSPVPMVRLLVSESSGPRTTSACKSSASHVPSEISFPRSRVE